MIPAARQRVKIEGQTGVFLVVWVDSERCTADLIPLTQGNLVETVPFSRIRPLHGDALDDAAIG